MIIPNYAFCISIIPFLHYNLELENTSGMRNGNDSEFRIPNSAFRELIDEVL